MKIKKTNGAVSEIIGTMLLLIIAISALSIIYFHVLSDDGPSPETFVKIAGKVIGTNVILEHQGGEPLELDAKLSITIVGDTNNTEVGDWLNDENNNGKWNLGERLIFPFEYNLSRLGEYRKVDVMAVDDETNSIVLTGPIELHPVSDVGMTITVDNPSPEIDEDIQITITVTSYGGDVAGSGNVSVRCLLPEGLVYISNSSTPEHGAYNNETGIWSVGDVLVGTPAILKINATVVGIETREFTQLAMVLDGSGSIHSSDWTLMTEGLSKAIDDPDIFPHDESVELSVIQFGVNPNSRSCRVEVPPTVVSNGNYGGITTTIENLIQGRGWTPMAAGLYLSADTLSDSSNFSIDNKQVICMVTDGEPTCWSDEGEYVGQGCSSHQSAIDQGKTSTEHARDYIITQLEMTDNQDEFDLLAVGPGPDISWLNASIAWPEPGYIAPPFDNGTGWVSKVDTWAEFSDRISEMFRMIFSSIPSTVELVGSTTYDPNDNNNCDTILIIPTD